MADTPMREAADFLKRLAKDYDRDGGLPSSYCDKLNEIAERLAPSESAPTGWKLVPVEPTPQMIDRMEGIGADEPSPDGISWQEWQRRRWHWILAAAPRPNAAPQKDRSGPRLTEETAPAVAAPGRDGTIAPAEAYVLAIQQSVGSILSQYAANKILDRAKDIANGN